MTQQDGDLVGDSVERVNPGGSSSVVLVCEHASNRIPEQYDNLGLSDAARQSHIAWDPGAMAVARHLSQRLDAVLIAGTLSRLIYDCNRPPDAPDAIPERSEAFDVPGNTGLTPHQRAHRVGTVYQPFRAALARTVAQAKTPVIVTIHSFTPVYLGQRRAVEIGVLHDNDRRLADAMLDIAPRHTDADVQRNQPYGPEHGVTHTLREHALPGGHLNVMLEIRNDLIATDANQRAMAGMLAIWIADAFARTHTKGAVTCTA